MFGKGLSPIDNYVLLASPYVNALAIFETDGTAHGSIYMRWSGTKFKRSLRRGRALTRVKISSRICRRRLRDRSVKLDRDTLM